MSANNHNPIMDWFAGDAFSVTPTNKGIKYYSRWRNRSYKRRNKTIESRCHYFEVVAWEWFSREPVIWFLRPWMIFGLFTLIASFVSSLIIWPAAAQKFWIDLGIIVAVSIFMSALVGFGSWYVGHYEVSIWPPLKWFFTKRLVWYSQPWSALAILIIAGFLLWKPWATFILLLQIGLVALIGGAIVAVLAGLAVGIVFVMDLVSEWRSRRPSESKQTIYSPTTEPNRVAQIYEEAHRWYKVRKYGCPIGPIDPKIDQM